MSTYPISNAPKVHTCLSVPQERPEQLPIKVRDRSGQLLKQRYRLERRLGGGVLSEVYAAFDLIRQRRCSLKLVHAAAATASRPHQRFLHEAAVISRLSHPNIVEVREFNQDADGTYFMVMELLEGEDLSSLLRRVGKLPLSRALKILRAVGSALQYIHDMGIVHCDIKPSNIFVARQPNHGGRVHDEEVIRLIDFGLAKMDSGDSHTESRTQGMIIGSPAYLAPEALLSHSDLVDARSDQWALAVMAYRMLSGQLPFQHPNPYYLGAMIREWEPQPLTTLIPELPLQLRRAIETAMSKHKEQRYPRIQDFIRAIDCQPLCAPQPREQQDPTLRAVREDLIALCRSEAYADKLRPPELPPAVWRRARHLPRASGLLMLALILPLLCKALSAGTLSILITPKPYAAAPVAAVKLPTVERRPPSVRSSSLSMPSTAPALPHELQLAAPSALLAPGTSRKGSELKKKPGSPPSQAQEPMLHLVLKGGSSEQDTDVQTRLPDSNGDDTTRIEIMP